MTTLPEDPRHPSDPARVPGEAGGAVADIPESAVLAEAAEILDGAVDAEEIASMDQLDAPRRIMFVHAHPDDETIGNGATMARYVAEGAHVTLVTCTLGEEGEVLVPELAHLAADQEDLLGRHRVAELAVAMEALGVTDHRYLGGAGRYRDSGMMGLPANERPDSFWQANVDEAAGQLVAVVREVRPQVVVTYDENGGYGHPDHIQAHRVAMRAVALAADASFGEDEPWRVAKVYWNVVPRSVIQEWIDALRGQETSFFDVESADELPFAAPDELVTTVVDAATQVEAKLAAMRAHATQIAVDGPFFALSNNIGQRVWGVEYYRCVQGEAIPDPDDPDGRESDLFAGVV
jgi:N-acetyl-1-D-myo-inositol-2-amino-2-deoxy-alpha-D-glucopyranoside deacetylase